MPPVRSRGSVRTCLHNVHHNSWCFTSLRVEMNGMLEVIRSRRLVFLRSRTGGGGYDTAEGGVCAVVERKGEDKSFARLNERRGIIPPRPEKLRLIFTAEYITMAV